MPPIVVILIVLLALAAIVVALVFPGKKKNLDENGSFVDPKIVSTDWGMSLDF